MKPFHAALAAALLLLAPRAFAQTLTQSPFPDGSGSIGVAAGWKLESAANGAAVITHPSGAAVVVGMPFNVVTRGVERYFPDVPVVFPGVPRVDFSDPVRAGLDFAAAKAQETGSRVTRVRAVEPIQWPNGRAAFVRSSGTVQGKPVETFGVYAVMPLDHVNAVFYCSQVYAPAGEFQKFYPAMMAMWGSWSVKDATLRARLQSAAKALGEVDFAGTVDEAVRKRREAAEAAAVKWNAYIRQ